MRYKNAPTVIDWLRKAFGFEKLLVVPGDNGTIAHAQLTFGNGMIMLGSDLDNKFGKLQKPPHDVGGVGTQTPKVTFGTSGPMIPGYENMSNTVRSSMLLPNNQIKSM